MSAKPLQQRLRAGDRVAVACMVENATQGSTAGQYLHVRLPDGHVAKPERCDIVQVLGFSFLIGDWARIVGCGPGGQRGGVVRATFKDGSGRRCLAVEAPHGDAGDKPLRWDAHVWPADACERIASPLDQDGRII